MALTYARKSLILRSDRIRNRAVSGLEIPFFSNLLGLEVGMRFASLNTFRVVVSSPFADLTDERNALQQYVFPRLSELCRRHGRRLHAIDLRWGTVRRPSLKARFRW